jgi:glutamate-ammonia-ligase adenylyltransferase
MSTAFPLLARMTTAPSPSDKARAARVLETLGEAGKPILEAPKGRALLEGLFGNSPYLGRLVLRDPPILARVLGEEPEQAFAEILRRMDAACAGASKLEDVMTALRHAKHETALLVALADVAGVWPVLTVTQALTDFADAALHAALRHLIGAEAAKGRLKPGEDPVRDSGYIVLGMGKYGAGELNYSSDIDLIVFFDPARFVVSAGQHAQSVAVEITRNLVRAMAEQTGDGYVFRTDLRLRPDAGATQVALSIEAAENYYESTGQNWERAAMIKARPCAGDIAAGEEFLAQLKPFLWRRHLDYAAIEDIHSIKRQIHRHGGHDKIAIAGHNIKLGRGGIREIEFFVQTQQLILGGREPKLRGRTTVGTLQTLATLGLITTAAAEELKAAYLFLRLIEHRLQMVDDAQTHTLPDDKVELEHIAKFCGFGRLRDFEATLRATLEIVQRHYAALFENEPPLAAARGNLVFTGVEDDPETLSTLTRMGFTRAAEVSALIRGWHHGRLRATRSPRAKELLTRLVPLLLAAFARTGDADKAFFRFSNFLEGLPAGVQLFSLLLAQPALLGELAQILGTAPRLASYLARHSQVIDAMLDQGFSGALPEMSELKTGLARALSEGRDYQDMLDATRRFAREQNFRVGIQVLNGVANPAAAGGAFSAIAETVLAGLLPPTAEALVEKHGTVPKGNVAVLALGKLGAQEMSATSDLDLIFVYDAPEGAQSKGPRRLFAPDYYARFAQRMVNALTVPTAEGKLYEVDMELRPSGRAGPLATAFASFAHYQANEAWTWEHMALTRARFIAGDAALGARLMQAVHTVLTRPRNPAKTAHEVVEMRAKIMAVHPSLNPWDIKHARGGTIDLEFITQYLELIHAAAAPDIVSGNTRRVLKRLSAEGLLDPAAAQSLDAAAELQLGLTQVLRVAVDGVFDPKEASLGLSSVLCRVGDAPTLGALERKLIEAERDVHALFGALVEQVAQL